MWAQIWVSHGAGGQRGWRYDQRLSGQQCGQAKRACWAWGQGLGLCISTRPEAPGGLPRGSVFLCPCLTQPIVKERDRQDKQVTDGSD